MICKNIGRNAAGHLTFGGVDTVELARKYGTPLYLMDEDRVRENCRVYTEGMKQAFPHGGIVAYAGKAACFRRLYRVMKEEGMYIDVVSSGEIRTASSAGYPMEHAFFHSNNKTDADIRFAMDHGVGYFVVDCPEELLNINAVAGERGICQKVLLRLTPGIDPHTFEAVATGKVDSKFGSAIETGQALEIFQKAVALANLSLEGFHCHVGSQVFDSQVFFDAAEIMLEFIARLKRKFGFDTKILDLGGGYGVRYVDSDPEIDIADNLAQVGRCVEEICSRLGLSVPVIVMEPGRSIVADAGMTLYTVGSVKRIPGYKNYVSVDGGMSDNPRFALYGSSYTVLAVKQAEQSKSFSCSVVGRCCESGDIIQENVSLPETIGRGDLLAVATTGAYNYSMASNYNRIPRPPVVMLSQGKDFLAVKRESLDDLILLDL